MELLYQYEEFLSTYSKTTKETYLECIRLYFKYIKDTYGKVNAITICNVKQSDIYNYIAYMDNLSHNSRKIRLYALKNFYKYLKINKDYFEDIKLYNSNKKMPYFLSSQQCELLINYYQDKRNKLIIYLLLTTGIRLSEITEIEINNINLKERYFIVMCKGRKERKIYLNEKCTNMIREYIQNKNGKLFEISSSSISQIVTKAMKKLNLKGSTHTLRHSFATIMYKQTKDILLVKELLGHESILSTQIYTHVINDEVKEAIERNPLANYEVMK